MRVRTVVESLMAIIDFDRACLAWTTKSGSVGRWRVIASATDHCRRAIRSGAHGDGGRRLWRRPAAARPALFVSDLRLGAATHDPARLHDAPTLPSPACGEVERASPIDDSAADNGEIFTQLTIDAPALAAPRIDLDRASTAWPLTARLRVAGGDGARWLLDFPVNHINHARNRRAPTRFRSKPGRFSCRRRWPQESGNGRVCAGLCVFQSAGPGRPRPCGATCRPHWARLCPFRPAGGRWRSRFMAVGETPGNRRCSPSGATIIRTIPWRPVLPRNPLPNGSPANLNDHPRPQRLSRRFLGCARARRQADRGRRGGALPPHQALGGLSFAGYRLLLARGRRSAFRRGPRRVQSGQSRQSAAQRSAIS